MISIDKLRFGTAGIPWSVKNEGLLEGIQEVRRLGLDSMELEFVRQVYVKKDKTPTIKDVAKKNDIILTSHGSYYINLNSSDKAKREASVERILEAARITAMCGGYSVCFHSAYYHNADKQEVNKRVTTYLNNIIKILRNEGYELWIRPETGGKIGQYADSYDLITLSTELEQVLPCFDFAHQYSRTLGQWNTSEEFKKLLEAVEQKLGKEGLHNMHIHMEGIEFTHAGERNHINLDECNFRYKDLLQVWKDFGIKGVVTCESPNIEQDALLLHKTYKSLS